ncbi:MBL fold metallo-hydrolase [Candidatus Parcubacteria bacterium]|nr:MBL fold metallo-hydrolase [Candidatus Parcubacteria bacterium]
MSSLKLTFCTGVGTVTGANFLLESDKTKILIDCGLMQGSHTADEENRKDFPYDPRTIDMLFVTHAHIDHIGRIPKLVRDGFKGIIYSTLETKEIAKLMLLDAVKIIEMESKTNGKSPMYFDVDVNQTFMLWQTIPYHQEKPVASDFKIYLKDAGHVLGSAIYEVTYNGKKLVFCNDLGNSPAMLLRDTEPVTDADYLIMDSVYGDRNHESKELADNRLETLIKETVARNGVLVIPSFSLERTQVILYKINNMIEDGVVRQVPVYLDSPLAIKITEIYRRPSSVVFFNEATQKDIAGGDHIFDFPKLKNVMRSEDSRAIVHTSNPKIIIAGSGMSSGGRVLGHEAHYLPDEKNTVVLIGYQAIGTFGRQLQDGVKEVMIKGEKITVRAHIENISGYSAHKDSDHLVEFVENTSTTVKKVFVVLGEPKSGLFLVQRLRDSFGVDALYPERGKVYELPC